MHITKKQRIIETKKQRHCCTLSANTLPTKAARAAPTWGKFTKGKSGNTQNLQRKIVSSKMATAAANVNVWPERSYRVFFF